MSLTRERLVQLASASGRASRVILDKTLSTDKIGILSEQDFFELQNRIEQLVLTGESLANLETGYEQLLVINHSNRN